MQEYPGTPPGYFCKSQMPTRRAGTSHPSPIGMGNGENCPPVSQDRLKYPAQTSSAG